MVISIARERPLTGSKASSPRMMLFGGTPAASAQAMAASALSTLWRPAMCSVKCRSPAGVRDCTDQARPFHTAQVPTTSASAAPAAPSSSSAKVQWRRPSASASHSAVNASPCGNTATPSAGRALSTAPFSRATASTVAMNSRCSRCALLTSATVGRAMAASCAISPGWFMPSSSTATRWPSRRRSKVSGTPMSLLKLPWVASDAPAFQACRMAASICVTVVLPLEPATAISGSVKRARQALARAPSAALVSPTSSPLRPAAASPAPGWQMAATAPLACAWARNWLASKCSPLRATNRSPGCRLRVSVCTRSTVVPRSPTGVAPGSICSAWAKVIIMRPPPVRMP